MITPISVLDYNDFGVLDYNDFGVLDYNDFGVDDSQRAKIGNDVQMCEYAGGLMVECFGNGSLPIWHDDGKV